MSNIKNNFSVILIFIPALFFTSCSSLNGPLFKPVMDIPPEESVVYIYRMDDVEKKAFVIEYNDKEICILENGGYFPFFVKKGKVKLTSSIDYNFFTSGLVDLAAGKKDFVFEADAGKSYYVKCHTTGAVAQELSIQIVPENFGSKNIKECRLLEPVTE